MSASTLASRVIKSIFFKKALEQAVNYARNNQKASELLDKVSLKAKDLHQTENNASFLENLSTLRRMLRAYKQGEYREVPWRSVILVVASLLYFVSPLDFIPDLLPILGLADDIALILWVSNSIKSDIEKFRKWESQQITLIREQL